MFNSAHSVGVAVRSRTRFLRYRLLHFGAFGATPRSQASPSSPPPTTPAGLRGLAELEQLHTAVDRNDSQQAIVDALSAVGSADGWVAPMLDNPFDMPGQ